jgi:hypothetical protein
MWMCSYFARPCAMEKSETLLQDAQLRHPLAACRSRCKHCDHCLCCVEFVFPVRNVSTFFVATYPLAGEPTHTCFDFCLDFMKCNSSIYDMIKDMKTKQPVYATMSEQDVLSTATTRICESIGVSPNYNDAESCFNGIELGGESKKLPLYSMP